MQIRRSEDDAQGKPQITIFQRGKCNPFHDWTGSAELVQDVISRLTKIPYSAWYNNPNAICISADFLTQEVSFVAHALNYSRTIPFAQFLAIPHDELPQLTWIDGVRSLAEYQPA